MTPSAATAVRYRRKLRFCRSTCSMRRTICSLIEFALLIESFLYRN